MKRDMLRIVAFAIAAGILCAAMPFGAPTAFAASGDPDIGCYEYGYASAAGIANSHPVYPDGNYGGGGNDYYVAASGSDSTGNGSSDYPWKTLAFAAEMATVAGDVIHLAAGDYDENEKVLLSPGVSIEGAGDGSESGEDITTIRTSFLPRLLPGSELWYVPNAIIELVSIAVTNGAQHISGIRFEGDWADTTTPSAGAALEIRNRSNVQVRDCTFEDFALSAVGWRSSLVNAATGAGTYATGGSFNDNIVLNCAGKNVTQGYYFGALFCGGLEGFLIYNNRFTEGQRDAGKAFDGGSAENGVPIKLWYYDGWVVNSKIYNNYLEKSWIPRYPTDGNGWPFAIEATKEAGLEIYDNTIIGTIDTNYGMRTVNGSTYDYSIYIHDNAIGPESYTVNKPYDGICLEGSVDDVLIERNIIRNCCPAIWAHSDAGLGMTNLTIRYNLCTGIRCERADWYQEGIALGGAGTASNPRPVTNLSIYNNVLQGVNSSFNETPGSAIDLECYEDGSPRYSGSGITISNNIITGFGGYWLTNRPALDLSGLTTISGLSVENNLLYSNASSTAYFGGDAPEGYVNNGNITGQDPLFVSGTDFHLQAASPAVDAGRSIAASTVSDLDGNDVPYDSDAPPASVPVTGIALSSSSLFMKVGDTASLSASLLPANHTESLAVSWVSSAPGVATVSDGTLTAKAEGSATVTASAGSFSVSCSVTVAAFNVTPNIVAGASKLYEPWGLRYFATYEGSDASLIANRGIAILKGSYYTTGMTAMQLAGNANAHLFTSSANTLTYDTATSRYYATLTSGIYSYDISALYYVAPYAVMQNGTVIYGSVKSNSMQRILTSNLSNSAITAKEKAVCTCILTLRDSVTAHYTANNIPSAGTDAVIPRGSSQSAATVTSESAAGVSANVTAGASRLIEPWGLRFFASYTTGSQSISDLGIVILHSNYYQSSYSSSPESMRRNANAYIFQTSDSTLSAEFGTSRLYATLTAGITSRNIADKYYVVPFVVTDSGAYVYGSVKSNSMLAIMQANLVSASVPATEKAVSRDIIALYNAVKAYYE